MKCKLWPNSWILISLFSFTVLILQHVLISHWANHCFCDRFSTCEAFLCHFPALSPTLSSPRPTLCELHPQGTELPSDSPIPADSEDEHVPSHPGVPSPRFLEATWLPHAVLRHRDTAHTLWYHPPHCFATGKRRAHDKEAATALPHFKRQYPGTNNPSHSVTASFINSN